LQDTGGRRPHSLASPVVHQPTPNPATSHITTTPSHRHTPPCQTGMGCTSPTVPPRCHVPQYCTEPRPVTPSSRLTTTCHHCHAQVLPCHHPTICHPLCHGSAQGIPDTTVMTTCVKSMISHGLLMKRLLGQALMWCLRYCISLSHAHGHQSS
jgi:hypothetical protein